jgi:hypothetical protein
MVMLLLTSYRIGFTPFSLLFPLVPTLSFTFTHRYTQTNTPMLQLEYRNPTQSLSDLVASSFYFFPHLLFFSSFPPFSWTYFVLHETQ